MEVTTMASDETDDNPPAVMWVRAIERESAQKKTIHKDHGLGCIFDQEL
jgi:hypothetical protein